ncbi:MAG: aminotransferase class IV [Anaerolineae bacterium]|nr:aminotransferase class IV [Anaerolineae bacterium]MDQ7033711.1 aminotransferase class IV [Anaerolineae bacterium]
MPTLIKILTPEGLVDAPYTADSLAEAAQYEPADGVYTVANTFNTYDTLKLDAHFDRLEDSARRANIPLKLDRKAIRYNLRMLIQVANYGSVRFRVTVPRETPDNLILSIEPFTPLSPEFIAQGVRCITAVNSARNAAEAKTTDWMHARKALQAAMPDGIYDTFLLDNEGYLLEGLGANFYAILNDTLHTAASGVLKGISQQIVLEIAPDILAVKMEAVHISDLSRLSEAFLTSSSRGIIPVVEIDGIPIGTGTIGIYTQKLLDAYQAWLEKHLLPL